ncbi:MAG: YdaU family protein [bacterium]|nr:YdaU family protein [bacterium]
MSRRGKPVSFQFYAPDWLSDPLVRSMSLASRGAYIDLLAYAFVGGGSVPESPDALRRLVGAAPGEEWRGIWRELAGHWPCIDGGGRANPKLSLVMADAQSYRAQKSAAGKASALSRQRNGNGTATEGATKDQREVNPPSPSPSPSPSQTPTPPDPEPPRATRAAPGQPPAERAVRKRTGGKKKPTAEQLIVAVLDKSMEPALDTTTVRAAWMEYERHRREKRTTLTKTARPKALAKLVTLSGGVPDLAVRILEQSVANGWTGLFALGGPKANGSSEPSQTGSPYLDKRFKEEGWSFDA